MNELLLTEKTELRYGRREAINSLKTNIKFAGEDVRVVMITSCEMYEGKSTTASDLAEAYAGSGVKTLLIDADMRNSVLLQKYKIDTGDQEPLGLTHYLSGQTDAQSIVNATNLPNYFITLAGPLSPNPTELLAGNRFDLFLKAARNTFDMIIIDSPPLGAVIDAAMIGPKCDGTVLITEANVTSARSAISAKKQLEMTGTKLLGSVLNKVPQSGSAYRYRYKGYGYGDRYGYGYGYGYGYKRGRGRDKK